MAKMTASEAIEMSKYEVSTFVKRRGEIAALIQQQQQTIEAIQKEIGCRYCKHSGYCQKYLTVDNCNDWQVKEGK